MMRRSAPCLSAACVLSIASSCGGSTAGVRSAACDYGTGRCGLVLGGDDDGTQVRPSDTPLYVGLYSAAGGLMATALGSGHFYLASTRVEDANKPGNPDRNLLLDQADRNQEAGLLSLSAGIPLLGVAAALLWHWKSERNEFKEISEHRTSLRGSADLGGGGTTDMPIGSTSTASPGR